MTNHQRQYSFTACQLTDRTRQIIADFTQTIPDNAGAYQTAIIDSAGLLQESIQDFSITVDWKDMSVLHELRPDARRP